MNIDWSKAPEGATHFNKAGGANHRLYSWMQLLDGEWFFYRDGIWERQLDNFPDKHDQLVDRPITWHGEGLPPVGTDVEIHQGLWNVREESKCFLESPVRVAATFKMLDSNVDMIAVDGGLDRGCEVFRAEMAKPARTPEQIAAEARTKGIQEMREAAGSLNNFPFEQLYDAGYRKQVQP